MEDTINCFSCGAKSLNIQGETHKYMLSSPGCYAMFCEVLEKEYSDWRYAKAHHLTVDSYACQHPGSLGNSKAINSVGIHLVSLFMLLEREMDLVQAAQLKMGFSQYNKQHQIVVALTPPEDLGSITIYDIWCENRAEPHFEKVRSWAQSVWFSWERHQKTIGQWADEFLSASRFKIQQ